MVAHFSSGLINPDKLPHPWLAPQDCGLSDFVVIAMDRVGVS